MPIYLSSFLPVHPVRFPTKISDMVKDFKKQFEETNQALQSDINMAEMLKLSDHEFNNYDDMLRALMETSR